MSKKSLNLAEIKARLKSLALELLKGRFPKVDVESYYKAAETLVEEHMKWDKAYRRKMEGTTPLETLIALSMDKVQTAYLLISGVSAEEKLDRLLKDYETMVGDYLQSIGLLTEL